MAALFCLLSSCFWNLKPLGEGSLKPCTSCDSVFGSTERLSATRLLVIFEIPLESVSLFIVGVPNVFTWVLTCLSLDGGADLTIEL